MYHCGLCGFKDESLKVVEQHAANKHQLVRIQNKHTRSPVSEIFHLMIVVFCNIGLMGFAMAEM